MDIIRRNTDYSLRLVAALAAEREKPLSASFLAKKCHVTRQLTSKLLQKLANAGIVESSLGPKGGYSLVKDISEISMKEMIEIIQGSVNVNACFGEKYDCPFKKNCPLREKLADMQQRVDNYFAGTTLADIFDSGQ